MTLLRLGWAVAVLLALALFAFSLPHMYAHQHMVCPGSVCPDNPLAFAQVSQADLRAFQQVGISMNFYAAFMSGMDILYVLIFCAVAGLLFWRRPDDRMAVYASLALVFFGVAVFISPLNDLVADLPGLLLPVQIIEIVSAVAFVSFFYLFPDGRFVPGWIRWMIPFVAVREALNVFVPNNPYDNFLFLVELGSIVYSQVFRYRRVSTPLQRQQTKWVVYGSTLAVLSLIALFNVGAALFGRLHGLGLIILPAIMYLLAMLIPLSIGMAVLRSHLWDIDILIRRTLVYSTLTVILAAAYAACVIALQQISLALTHQRSSPASIVLSTLAIAALFTPARRRVQGWIDRRFYRGQYDAEKVIGGFHSLVRSEVDLARLAGGLLGMVDETIQPESLSLWIKKPNSR